MEELMLLAGCQFVRRGYSTWASLASRHNMRSGSQIGRNEIMTTEAASGVGRPQGFTRLKRDAPQKLA